MSQSKKIEVRDARKRQMYKVDDLYIDKFARICGINATAVYNSLCRHVNCQQESYPSIERIMEQHGFGSHNTVRKAIKELEACKIIQVSRKKDPKTKRQMVNIYTLTDSSSWVTPLSKNDTGNATDPMSPNDTRADVISDTDPMSFRTQKPVSPNDREGYTREKDTHRRVIATASVAVSVQEDSQNAKIVCVEMGCKDDPIEGGVHCKNHKPMNTEQFVAWCAKSVSPHIQIIGEWADTVKPDFTTLGQWNQYISRYVRVAKQLTPFTREQIESAYARIEEGIAKGWLTEYSLDTLYKFITNAKK